MTSDSTALLARLERYYDAVPRAAARAEDFGPLTLFVTEGPGWPYYARPTLGVAAEVTVADVEAVRVRQRELGIPEAFEWVSETTPGLLAPVEASGLVAHAYPCSCSTRLSGRRTNRRRTCGCVSSMLTTLRSTPVARWRRSPSLMAASRSETRAR